MTIHIIEEPDIHLTRDEYEKLRREWESMRSYSVNPSSFESYVRGKKTTASDMRTKIDNLMKGEPA